MSWRIDSPFSATFSRYNPPRVRDVAVVVPVADVEGRPGVEPATWGVLVEIDLAVSHEPVVVPLLLSPTNGMLPQTWASSSGLYPRRMYRAGRTRFRRQSAGPRRPGTVAGRWRPNRRGARRIQSNRTSSFGLISRWPARCRPWRRGASGQRQRVGVPVQLARVWRGRRTSGPVVGRPVLDGSNWIRAYWATAIWFRDPFSSLASRSRRKASCQANVAS